MVPALTRREFVTVTSGLGVAASGCLSAADTREETPDCLRDGELSLRADPDTRPSASQDTAIPVVEVTFSNGTACLVEVNPGTWQIEQRASDEDETEVVASGEEDAPPRRLENDESHTWVLYQGPPSDGPTESGTTFVDVSGLPDGRYLFVVTGLVADQMSFTRSVEFTTADLRGDQ